MRCPDLSMDIEALQSLPFSKRMQAYDDFDTAVASWAMSRWLRNHTRGWGAERVLEMRRALRAWKRYAEAVRTARNMRIAA